MDERIRLAIEVDSLREEFVAIHDDIFAPPLWRAIRRALPFPLVFEAIDFSRHADRLAVVRLGLETRREDLVDMRDRATGSPSSNVFSIELEQFIVALTATVKQLLQLCIDMAADRRTRPTWSEYNKRVSEYETLRQTQMRVGVDVQKAFEAFKREA